MVPQWGAATKQIVHHILTLADCDFVLNYFRHFVYEVLVIGDGVGDGIVGVGDGGGKGAGEVAIPAHPRDFPADDGGKI